MTIAGETSMEKNNEVILAIILESSKGIRSFTRSWTKLHQFFYKISQDPKYSDLFEDLLFDTNGPIPFSEEIDEILGELQLSGIIGSPNPVLKVYSINVTYSDIEKRIDDFYTLPDEVMDNIKDIASKFSSELT